MKRIVLIFSLMIVLASCSNNEYQKALPPGDKNIYAFQDFQWSPDGAYAAVYMGNRLYIITPDGNQIKESVKLGESQFERYGWHVNNASWVFESRSARKQIEAETVDEESHSEKNYDIESDTERKQFDEEFHENLYEEYKFDEDNAIYLSYTGKYFEVVKVDLGKKEYITLFNSVHILFGLNHYKGDVYFLGVNPKDNMHRYVLYKVIDNKVERVSIRPYTRHR